MATNEFGMLRDRARERRDKMIETARKEYEDTLRRIAELEQDLLGRDHSRHQKINACIERVIPSGSEFTTVDIMTGLEALDPTRHWRKRSVDAHISVLREKGILRRVKRSCGNAQPAIYVRADVPTKPRPFEDMRLHQVIEAVLAGKSMTATELTLAILDAGYQTKMNKKPLRDAIGGELRRFPTRFKADGAKWSVVG